MIRQSRATVHDLKKIKEIFGKSLQFKNLDFCYQQDPELIWVSSEKTAEGKPSGFLANEPLDWHSDNSYKNEDYFGTALLCLDSSETFIEWINTGHWLKQLDDQYLKRLREMTCVHSIAKFIDSGGLASYQMTDQEIKLIKKTGTTKHKLIRTHPVNGNEYCYLSPTFVSESNFKPNEFEDLLEKMISCSPIYSHYWEPGDLIIYDNLMTIHRRSASRSHRSLIRIQFNYDNLDKKII